MWVFEKVPFFFEIDLEWETFSLYWETLSPFPSLPPCLLSAAGHSFGWTEGSEDKELNDVWNPGSWAREQVEKGGETWRKEGQVPEPLPSTADLLYARSVERNRERNVFSEV